MSEPESRPTSLGDIAKHAGVSRMSVSCALRNRPGISKATRRKILRIAKQLKYIPDARVATLMTKIRDTKHRDFLPIAWINVGDRAGTWSENKFLSPYFDGAFQRCKEAGYQLVEFQLNQNGMTSSRLSQILYQRGIQGVIVAPPLGLSIIHLRLNWEYFATVSFENALAAPRIHQVVQNQYFNILLALKNVKRAGYRRIGMLIDAQSNRRSYHACEAALGYFQAPLSRNERIPPLISTVADIPKEFYRWLDRYKPDVVVGRHSELCNSIRSRGLDVPGDVGVVHLALDGDCMDWCGILANKWEIGSATADLVISLIQNNQFGLPKTARETLINGTWQPGNTLLVPKRTSPSSLLIK